MTGAQHKEGAGGLVEQRTDYFHRHVANLARGSAEAARTRAGARPRSFAMAQWAKQSSAAAAVQQMGTALCRRHRCARSAGARAPGPLRRSGATATRRCSQPFRNREVRRIRAAIGALRKEIAETESKLAANHRAARKEFPEYAALASPKPLKAEEVQKLLGADEALVFFANGRQGELRLRADARGLRVAYDCARCRKTSRRRSPHSATASMSTKLQNSADKPVLFDLDARARAVRRADRSRRSAGQGQAASPRGALGSAHLASIPSAGDGEAGKPVMEVKDIARLPRRRLADQTSGGDRAAFGREPQGVAVVRTQGREHEIHDRLRRSDIRSSGAGKGISGAAR